MGKWKLGVSAKEFGQLQQYVEQFKLVEVDLERAEKLGFPMPKVVEQIRPYQGRVYSVHLRYNTDEVKGTSGIATSIGDLEFLCNSGIMKELGVSLVVTHTDYPKDDADLNRQLERLGAAAAKYGIVIAVENLADRSNKTRGYMGPRNPRVIAEFLAKHGNPNLGLCLDTGHAISNAGLTDSLEWDNGAMRKWIRHVHYNDNILRGDEHMPVCQATNPKLIASLKYLFEASAHEGVAIFEHRKMAEAVQSMMYAQTPEYRDIAPAPLK